MESKFGGLATPRVRFGRFAGGVGRVLFPHFCVSCGLEGRILCRTCEDRISAPLRGVFLCPACGCPSPLGAVCAGRCRRRSALNGAVSMTAYGHPELQKLLRDYKYGGVEEAGEALEDIWAFWLGRLRPLIAALVSDSTALPVPLHFFRESRRGFNQADRLAAAVGRSFGIPVNAKLLKKRFRWRSQARIGSAGLRSRNAAGTFFVPVGETVGRRVVMVDDVLTTGATLQECARVLKKAGAGSVWALTLLRG